MTAAELQAIVDEVVAYTGAEHFRTADPAHVVAVWQGIQAMPQPSSEPQIAVATPTFPPVLEQLGNAVGSAVRWLVAGCPVSSAEEIERRLSICGPCDRFVAAEGRCMACGCAMTLKARAETDHCVLGKW